MKKIPNVAIVGRANVGKSSLFNRLVGERQAVVADEPGTTRDRVQAIAEHDGKSFRLVDTAGFKTAKDEFEASIQDQIAEASAAAEVLLVVVEADTMVTEEDRRVAKIALKSKKPVILILNKIDKAHKKGLDHWEKLGIKQQIETSAIHNVGMVELLEAISQHIPAFRAPRPDNILRIALVGRPNVGKSYLFNTLAKKQQAIVADVAGTTRDINRASVTYEKQAIELLDTAGIRRPGKIERGVEHFSILRTLSAIDEADVCLLLIDVNELNTHLDQKIAGLVKDAGKGLVIVVSKWDSIEKDAFTRDALAPKIANAFVHVWWAPLIFTSAVTGQNATKLFPLALEIATRRKTEIKTPVLNSFLKDCLADHPPAGLKNRHPKLRYITQTGTNPPTFTVFGTSISFLHWSYKRYLEKQMRLKWDFIGTPVDLKFKENRDD